VWCSSRPLSVGRASSASTEFSAGEAEVANPTGPAQDVARSVKNEIITTESNTVAVPVQAGDDVILPALFIGSLPLSEILPKIKASQQVLIQK